MKGIIDWVTSLFPTSLPNKPNWFVEAGAHDGIGDSQTVGLERLGWTGLCVEPSSAFAALKRNRQCKVDNCCLGARTGEVMAFREVAGNAIELSGVVNFFNDHWDRETRPHRDILKTTTSLTNLLVKHHAPATIQFLSLDTEGSEHAILAAHDFTKYRFLSVQVEHNGVEQHKSLLRSLLTSKGYELIDTDGINDRLVYKG